MLDERGQPAPDLLDQLGVQDGQPPVHGRQVRRRCAVRDELGPPSGVQLDSRGHCHALSSSSRDGRVCR